MTDQVGEIARQRARYDKGVVRLAWAQAIAWLAVVLSMIAGIWTGDARWLGTAAVMIVVGLVFMSLSTVWKERRP